MPRFLMFISYIGTRYSGIQIQKVEGIARQDVITVQGVLENFLKRLHRGRDVKIYTSSRTDAGVHALCNSVHFDLFNEEEPDREYNPLHLMCRLNTLLWKAGESIRVLKICRVNDDFHCRHRVLSRHYLYRLAFVDDQSFHPWALPFSPLEFNRCFFVLPPYDKDKFLEAVDALSGTHDFTAFTTEKFLRKENKNPVKRVTVGVKKGHTILDEHQDWMVENFDLWEVHFKSRSFLYKQVRRMMGAAVQVSRGRIQLSHLKQVLENPEYYKSIPQHAILSVPASGLYLKMVEYDPKDLEYDPQASTFRYEQVDCSSSSLDSPAIETEMEKIQNVNSSVCRNLDDNSEQSQIQTRGRGLSKSGMDVEEATDPVGAKSSLLSQVASVGTSWTLVKQTGMFLNIFTNFCRKLYKVKE